MNSKEKDALIAMFDKVDAHVEQAEDEIEQLQDQLRDAQDMLQIIANSLEVEAEPHQTFYDRLLVAAKYSRRAETSNWKEECDWDSKRLGADGKYAIPVSQEADAALKAALEDKKRRAK